MGRSNVTGEAATGLPDGGAMIMNLTGVDASGVHTPRPPERSVEVALQNLRKRDGHSTQHFGALIVSRSNPIEYFVGAVHG